MKIVREEYGQGSLSKPLVLLYVLFSETPVNEDLLMNAPTELRMKDNLEHSSRLSMSIGDMGTKRQ